jgi:hypothetical protein
MIQTGKQEKWRSLLSEQEQSGQSMAAFCRERQLSKSECYYWKKRLREAGMPQFMEVQVAKPYRSQRRSAMESAIEVRLSNGRSLQVAPGFDATHLRELLAVLESA